MSWPENILNEIGLSIIARLLSAMLHFLFLMGHKAAIRIPRFCLVLKAHIRKTSPVVNAWKCIGL